MFKFCGIKLEGPKFAVIDWRQFSLEEIISKKGKAIKRSILVYKITTLDEFLHYFKPKLDFVKHNFVAKWKDKHFRDCLKSFPKDTMVSIVNFVENYTFEVENKFQSMHWRSFYISILVHICCHYNPIAIVHDEDS